MIVKWLPSTQSLGTVEDKEQSLPEGVNGLNNPRSDRLDSGMHIHQY
jgi:hypothetical protein